MHFKTIVGKLSSGAIASVPQLTEVQSMEEYIDSLPANAKAELYCILETVLLDEMRTVTGQTDISLQIAHLVLNKMTKSSEMSQALEKLGVRTPFDRVRLGRKLRI